jgi:hypothetical protein
VPRKTKTLPKRATGVTPRKLFPMSQKGVGASAAAPMMKVPLIVSPKIFPASRSGSLPTQSSPRRRHSVRGEK